MFRRMSPLDLVGNTVSLGRIISFVKRRGRVRVEIIAYKHDSLDIRVCDINKLFYLFGKVDGRLTGHILNAMMRGVSTRNYKEILPDACQSVGISKSSISVVGQFELTLFK